MVCMSRMFLFENWQLFLSSIEIYKYYGVDVIATYIQCVITDIYTIMKAYEKDGLLILRPAVKFFQPVRIMTFGYTRKQLLRAAAQLVRGPISCCVIKQQLRRRSG